MNGTEISILPAKLIRQPPVKMDTILTKDEFLTLARHMMSGNPISHFLTVWRDEEGEAQYAKANPAKRFDNQATWAYDTIADKAKVKTGVGVYPKNQDNKSTFAALDFDAHTGSHEVARGRAIRAFSLLLEYRDRYLILSASGRGYHVFVLANEPRPVGEWTRLLTDVVSEVPAPIQDGQCELFPADGTEKQPVGKGIRMPGTYNPNTDSVELIIAETIRPLLDRLTVEENSLLYSRRDSSSPSNLLLNREANSCSYSKDPNAELKNTQKEKSTKIQSKALSKPRSFVSTSTDRMIEEVLAKYPINNPSTRNGILTSLAGDLFNKFGWHLSLAIVEEHYCRNRANITSSPETNIREFERIWEGIRNKKIEALSASERSIYEKLNTSSQQEAFFIVQSFDYCRNESADFPLAQLSLADRLNFTQRGAGYLIRRLKDLGTIKKTAEARIHNRPATYRWTANETVKDGM